MSYQEYLKLDTILSSQEPKTDELDEMLFIITHQTCELWFKQILLELEDLIFTFGNDTTIEKLDRISTIFTQIINQISILETMSPSSFAKFRSTLGCASGLQSVQFRYVESILGLENMVCPTMVNSHLTEEQVENRMYLYNNSLFKKVDTWLSNIDYDVDVRFQKKPDEIEGGRFSPRSRAMIVYIFKYNTPELKILMRILDIDQKLSLFRYRHVQLVRYMIGTKVGTGGTACGYLQKTLTSNIFGEISELIARAL